jgi:hypothetical protein
LIDRVESIESPPVVVPPSESEPPLAVKPSSAPQQQAASRKAHPALCEQARIPLFLHILGGRRQAAETGKAREARGKKRGKQKKKNFACAV